MPRLVKRTINTVARDPVNINYDEIKRMPCGIETQEEDIYEPLEQVLGDNPNNITYTYVKTVRKEKINKKYILLSNGKVFTLYNDQFLSIFVWDGYLATTLDVNGKRKTTKIHQLMGEHFLINPDPENKTFVDHLNGDRNNNDISNLRWADESQNRINRSHQRTSQIPILQFDTDGDFIQEFSSQRLAAIETNTLLHRISECLRGHIDYAMNNDGIQYFWEYKEKRNEKPPHISECKNIPDFPGYLITKTKIYSIKYKRYIKLTKSEYTDYIKVTLCKNDKNFDRPFHDLLAEAWIEDKPEDYKNYKKWIVNHKNGFKDDNRLENLEYATPFRNVMHSIYDLGHGSAKKVYMLDFLTGKFLKIFASIAKASRYLKITEENIRSCCKGRTITCKCYDFILEEDLKKELDDVNENLKNKLIKIRACEQNIDLDILQDSDEENDLEDTDDESESTISIYSLGIGTARKVHHMDFNSGEILQTFESLHHAGRYFDIHIEAIRRCANGTTLFCKDICFIYDDELKKKLSEATKNTRKKLLRNLLFKKSQDIIELEELEIKPIITKPKRKLVKRKIIN